MVWWRTPLFWLLVHSFMRYNNNNPSHYINIPKAKWNSIFCYHECILKLWLSGHSFRCWAFIVKWFMSEYSFQLHHGKVFIVLMSMEHKQPHPEHFFVMVGAADVVCMVRWTTGWKQKTHVVRIVVGSLEPKCSKWVILVPKHKFQICRYMYLAV